MAKGESRYIKNSPVMQQIEDLLKELDESERISLQSFLDNTVLFEQQQAEHMDSFEENRKSLESGQWGINSKSLSNLPFSYPIRNVIRERQRWQNTNDRQYEACTDMILKLIRVIIDNRKKSG